MHSVEYVRWVEGWTGHAGDGGYRCGPDARVPGRAAGSGLIALRCYFLAAALLLLLPTAAAAQPDTGVYLEGYGGYSFPDPVDVSDADLDGEVELEEAFLFGGALGYRFPWARIEANVSYRENGVDAVEVEGEPFGGDGETTALVGLINAYLDLDFGLPVHPYVGGGVGAAYLSLDTDDGSPLEIDDEAGAFAWNLIAGVGYDVTESISLSASYRYLRLAGTDFSADVVGIDIGDVEVDDVTLHEVLLGLRYTF
jgi:OmpA-OmpF porin, OOP family